MKRLAIVLSLATLVWPALAAGQPRSASTPTQPQSPPRAATTQPPPLQRMQLQAQYAGPLQDTVIQRWRDPIDGTICYVYLPVAVGHSPPTPTGFVQYGSNGIGSISCIPPKY